MKNISSAPTKSRVIQGDAYSAEGYDDFAFAIYQPFTAEHFTLPASEFEISAAGLANGLNQLLAENLGNNMASRVKSVVKFNEELAEAQEADKREDESFKALPGQEDMDALLEAYDFSGVRVSSGVAGHTPLEKALYKYARQVVRASLKENGHGTQAAPVTVAKKGEDPNSGQVSYDTFDGEVGDLVEANGVWSENDAYADFRQKYVVEPAEAQVAADEKATVEVSLKLGL